MKTDAQRLELVLKFVNGGDVERANQRWLRESLASFLGYPLLEDDAVVPDAARLHQALTNRWPSNIGGTSFEVSAHIDMTDFHIHMSYTEVDVFIWYTLSLVTGFDGSIKFVNDIVHGPDVEDANQRERRDDLAKLLGYPPTEVVAGYAVQESLAAFLGFGPEAVPVPVGVLRELQHRTRRLIHQSIADREADKARHATWVERGPGTEERRAVGERKLPKDTMSYVNELAEQLDGTPTVVGRGANLRTLISAAPVDAYQWIVLLLVTGQPAVRACANGKCERLFVGTRKTKLYCADRCGQAVRDHRHYWKPETRKRKVEYIRAKRASERR